MQIVTTPRFLTELIRKECKMRNTTLPKRGKKNDGTLRLIPWNSQLLHDTSDVAVLQRAGESYAVFSLSLRHRAATCSYRTFLDDALKSQFYHNISTDMVRDKIKGSFPSLLGISWISHIHLGRNAVFSVNYVRQVQGDVVGLLSNTYPSVFKEVPGDIKGVEVNVVLKEGAIPISLISPRPLTVVQVATETRKDPILSRVLTNVLDGWPVAVPNEVIVGGLSKQISTSHPRLRDPKAVPVEFSWEMVEQAMSAPMPTPTADGPTSPVPEPFTNSTPEVLRQAPSVMAPDHIPVRPAAASPRMSAPLNHPPGQPRPFQ
uniref:(California timema) hypothetical protein n=1 Tax=Timema californicum TaxID=61474 RepID=A0A7R9JEQ9_TIMCA|nr:unnamed protein product [Timema californicum]